MAVRPAPAAWTEVEERQLARLTGLADLLEGYSHTSSYDRRDRQTGAQRAAPDQASAVLAGGVPDAESARPGDQAPPPAAAVDPAASPRTPEPSS